MNESLPAFVRTHFLPLLLMLTLAFCVFGNTLGHDWTYDDFPVVVENPDVKSWSGFLENRYPGRPIREITYLVDHTLFGSNPSGYHAQSILWHGLAGFLIYRVMVALGLGGLAGLLSGVLFIVHPITVEAVANVSHRKESLSLVFSLLALITYQRAFKTSSMSWLFVLGSFGFAAIAFMSKQTAVCLPFVFLAYEWVFVDRERWKLLCFWKALTGMAAAGSAGGLLWLWTNGGVERYIFGFQGLLQSKSNYFGPAQFDVYFQTLLKSWAFSFSKLLFPVELSAEYIIVPPQGWLTPWVLSGLMLVIGITGALLWSSYRRSPLFFWLILGCSFYLPVSNVWPLAYLAADRYLYVPWAAVSMAVAWLLCKCCPRPVVVASLVTGIVIVLTLLTWQQNRVWASPDALWTHALKVNPKSSFVLNNVGNLHLLRNDDAGALSYYRKAIKVNPINPTAWYNLGYIFENQRNMPLAIKYYQQFINVAEGPWKKDVQRLQSHLLMNYRVQLKRGPFDPSIMPP